VNKTVSLPEKDYLFILEVILKLYKCETYSDFEQTFQKKVLPLIDAQSGDYGFWDQDVKKIIKTKSIGKTKETQSPNEVSDLHNPLFAGSQGIPRPVIAQNIDFRKETKAGNFEGRLFVRDFPDFNAGVSLRRDSNIPWTLRDIRIMELLGPHLFQALKIIALSQELSHIKLLAETLADTPTAIALIRNDMRVVFHNKSFSNLFSIRHEQKVPRNLEKLIIQNTVFNPKSDFVGMAVVKLPFFRHPKGVFRTKLFLLKGPGFQPGSHWLMKLIPPGDVYSKMNLIMQEKGLTGREMEVCVLAVEGMANQEIAERLFISSSTIKKHLNKVYKKFAVHSRTQLTSFFR
jgi:DNA-binding CsgD family transcriptional regulator